MLWRGLASAALVGSSNAVCPVHCTRLVSESQSLKAKISSGRMRGA